MTSLEGKNAVVTGGGRGIGASIATALAGAGARVVVSARSVAEIASVADALVADGHRAVAIPCDVTDPDSVAKLRKGSEEAFGTIDILINNAGIANAATLEAITLDLWNQTFAVNATGTMLCTQAFVPPMVAAGWGRVVNVASIAGKAGAAAIGTYAASKHAVIGFTRSIAMEVARRGVTVNAVCPGYVDTAMSELAVTNISAKKGLSEEEARDKLRAMSPQFRVFAPEEVAFLTVSLCDPAAAGINGQAVVLDGGAVQS